MMDENAFYHVMIRGLSPLLLDAFPVCTELPNGGRALKGRKPLPAEEAEGRLYKMADGTLYVPGPNLYSAIIAAGAFQKVGKRQLTNAKTSIIPGGIMLLEPEMPITPQDWVADSRPIVNASGSRTIVHRPRFDKWELSFTLDVDHSEFTEAQARQLVDDAGRKIGLGVFRPQRKGPFGRFTVIRWEEQNAV